MQLPKTLKDYYRQEDIEFEERDKAIEKTYEELVAFLNKIDQIELTKEMKNEFLKTLDFQPIFNMYVKNGLSEGLCTSQIERIMDEIFDLGPEYGFLLDIIVEFFVAP